MANDRHVDQLRKGALAWNRWREKQPGVNPDLSGAQLDSVKLRDVNLSGGDLRWVSFCGADLRGANLDNANLFEARLCKARLSGATLIRANIVCVDLRGGRLQEANLSGAHIFKSNLSKCNLTNASLAGACITDTSFVGATLVGTHIYGASAWDLDLTLARQSELRIEHPSHGPECTNKITVDDLEVAQFVWLMLHNQKIRKVIGTIGQKAVLILGRFTPERKAVLDAIRSALRQRGFVPILFDFDRPTSHDLTETIVTLTGMSRFVIADITNPKSAPLELKATVPVFQIPFVPIIASGEEPFSMFADLAAQHGQKHGGHIMKLLEYPSLAVLLRNLASKIINPALALSNQLALRKGEPVEREMLT